MTRADPQTRRNETAVKARLRQEIEQGLADSRDPSNAGKPDPVTRKTTTIYSPWYTRPCPRCKHKFREGDRVRLCPECGQAFHDDDQYHLYCWQDYFTKYEVCRLARYDPIAGREIPGCSYRGPTSFSDPNGHSPEKGVARRIPQVTTQFLCGLENVWTPYGEEAFFEVEKDSPLVGRRCPWCRFQIRAGDRVVKCPCGECDTYFHDDIFRHLTCWDEWNGSLGNDYCPTTGAKIERETPSGGMESDDGR